MLQSSMASVLVLHKIMAIYKTIMMMTIKVTTTTSKRLFWGVFLVAGHEMTLKAGRKRNV